jgi:hypothetical protein
MTEPMVMKTKVKPTKIIILEINGRFVCEEEVSKFVIMVVNLRII